MKKIKTLLTWNAKGLSWGAKATLYQGNTSGICLRVHCTEIKSLLLMCLDFKLKFGITHNWKFYYITIRPAVLVWNTTTHHKTACESIQVQAVPWSTHHHTFVMSEFVSLLSSIHTIAPPCMLNWWVRCCAWTATNCHLLDPAVIAEGRAHSLARKNTKFAEFFLHRLFKGTHTFSNLSTKIDQQRRLDATGTYVDLVWCQQERLAHLCRGRTNTSHVPTLHLRQRWKVPTTHITFFQLLLSPEAAAIAPVYERRLANCV